MFYHLCFYQFHDGGPFHIETNPFIWKANQWTGIYMIGTTVMNELMYFNKRTFNKLVLIFPKGFRLVSPRLLFWFFLFAK